MRCCMYVRGYCTQQRILQHTVNNQIWKDCMDTRMSGRVENLLSSGAAYCLLSDVVDKRGE